MKNKSKIKRNPKKEILENEILKKEILTRMFHYNLDLKNLKIYQKYLVNIGEDYGPKLNCKLKVNFKNRNQSGLKIIHLNFIHMISSSTCGFITESNNVEHNRTQHNTTQQNTAQHNKV